MIEQIALKLNIPANQVTKVLDLLNQEATVPFIARYRKEVTGNLDEVQIFAIQKQKKYFEDLEKRKQSILKSLKEQGVLSEELERRIKNTYDSVMLEDLYLPFKKKKKTKAEEARNKGLEALAKIIMAQNNRDIKKEASRFLNEKIANEEEAIRCACYIISEWISENPRTRNYLRQAYERSAVLVSKIVKKKISETEAQKYLDYFDWSEKINKCPSHRFLAINRGVKEGYLQIKWVIDKEHVINQISHQFLKTNNHLSEYIKFSVEDAFKRLLAPSIEKEIYKKYKEKAEKEAIEVFAKNLKQLLLSPPLGEKNVLAIDPGFRTGSKIAVLNKQGEFLESATIYPHAPHYKTEQAKEIIRKLVTKYNIEAFSIGNGTASRETSSFIRSIDFGSKIPVFVVSEAGASIYSASEIARKEFPDLDITVRGAISIGRRLQDPLAELVKVEPKSIGVGQYQHDVNQTLLKEELEQVLSSVVNRVGVNINTASEYLLSYVSGIGGKLAKNIIEYRTQHGSFRSREELKKVKRLGEKAFEQSAGFLRIKKGDNPLDDSAVHPESYAIVNKMARSLGVSVHKLIGNQVFLDKIHPREFISKEAGILSIKDIIQELKKPGLDIRQQISEFRFSEELKSIDDLREGHVYPGIINNITNFGCFVDIGIKENGLIHISHLSNEFVSDPNVIVKLHQKIFVKVLHIDKERKRISLSLE